MVTALERQKRINAEYEEMRRSQVSIRLMPSFVRKSNELDMRAKAAETAARTAESDARIYSANASDRETSVRDAATQHSKEVLDARAIKFKASEKLAAEKETFRYKTVTKLDKFFGSALSPTRLRALPKVAMGRPRDAVPIDRAENARMRRWFGGRR